MSYKKGFNPTKKDGSFRLPEKTNSEILGILSQMNEDWISMIIDFTSDVENANSILHEVYLKLDRLDKLKKCLDVYEDGSVSINKSYMYLALRSASYDYLKAMDKSKKVRTDVFELQLEDVEDDSVENNEEVGLLIDRMNAVVDSCHWFDKQVFYLYNESQKSMAKLSEDVGISKSTIDQAVQRVKRAIREELREDYLIYRGKTATKKNIERWITK